MNGWYEILSDPRASITLLLLVAIIAIAVVRVVYHMSMMVRKSDSNDTFWGQKSKGEDESRTARTGTSEIRKTHPGD